MQQLYNEARVLLRFLPPYSLNYNSIETTFKDLKIWIKRNYTLVVDFEDFGNFLDFAICQVCKSEADIKGYFRKVEYIVNE